MSKGMSLHIGVNYLNPKGYPCEPPGDYPDGWDGPLESCEADADAMQELAAAQGFKTKLLKTEKATAKNVTKEIARAAEKLQAGDIFLLTYAGHGGAVPDRSRDERDGVDETWCLYDRQLLDDELGALYSTFREDVRILILSDSCHSGTVSRSGPGDSKGTQPKTTTRAMPPDSVKPIYLARKKEYDKIQKETKQIKAADIKASIRLLAACQDEQEANSGPFNGYFTAAVLSVWDDGNFEGDYTDFFEAVTKELDWMTGDSETRAAGGPDADERNLQTPNEYLQGKKSAKFTKQKPFTI